MKLGSIEVDLIAVLFIMNDLTTVNLFILEIDHSFIHVIMWLAHVMD